MSKAFRFPFRFPGSLVWILLAYGWAQWRYCVPFTGDEKVYVSIAMEMWERGDWLRPYLMGEPAYFKPPLQFWTTLIGWKLFGFGSFGTFFPVVIATVCTAAAIGALSRRLFDLPSAKITAPLWFAAAAGTLTYGTTAQMEAWNSLFYAAAWLHAIRFVKSKSMKELFLALGFAGLLSLVKSPLYSVLWVLGFWLHLLISREWRVARSARFWLAHVFGALIGISWFAWILAADGERFWTQYVLRETLEKTGGNGSSALHLWADFATLCLPYLLLFIPVFFLALRKMSRRTLAFAAGWALPPVLFFSFFPYRTETYLSILLPLVALFMDRRYSLGSSGLRVVRLFGRVNAVFVLQALAVISWIAFASRMVSGPIAGLLILAAAAHFHLVWKPRWRGTALACLLILFAFRLGSIHLGEEDIAGLREAVRANPEASITFLDESKYIWHEVGLLSVAVGKPLKRAANEAELADALKSGGMIVLGDSQWETVLPHLQSSRLEVRDWWRWKRAFQVPTIDKLLVMADRTDPQWQERHQRLFKIVSLSSARN